MESSSPGLESNRRGISESWNCLCISSPKPWNLDELEDRGTVAYTAWGIILHTRMFLEFRKRQVLLPASETGRLYLTATNVRGEERAQKMAKKGMNDTRNKSQEAQLSSYLSRWNSHSLCDSLSEPWIRAHQRNP